MNREYDRFKLDGAVIPMSGRPNQRVVVYNYNVPVDRVASVETFELIHRNILTDLPVGVAGTITPAYFQLTAVYSLVHNATNEERIWAGSFNPRAREMSQITAFRPFDAETFVGYCFNNSQVGRIFDKLNTFAPGRESVWRLNNIVSVVVSVQAVIRPNHTLFVNHPDLIFNGVQQRRKVFRTYFD